MKFEISMSSKNWIKIFEYDTIYSADSVEWCPIKRYHNYFICATYLLLEDEIAADAQTRIGTLLLMKVENNDLRNVDKLETCGILDLKWRNHMIDGKLIFGAVNAVGELCIYESINQKLHLLVSKSMKTDECGDYMTLAVNWFQDASPENQDTLCVTDNRGNCSIFSYSHGVLTMVEKWNAHSHAAWTVAFDTNTKDIMYSGGDDARLCVWDRRLSTTSPQTILKKHESGVTIIQTQTDSENHILTGGFDEILLFWDKRQWRRPFHELKCSGGLWRIRHKEGYILTANMHGGYQIIENSESPKVVADYNEHSSLAYGADWCHAECCELSDFLLNSQSSSRLIGTCSFYDHKLTVSMWDPV